MISRSEKANFLVSHYDKVAAGVGLLALAVGGAYFATTLGADPEASANDTVQVVERKKPTELGVKPTDLSEFAAVVRQVRTPQTVVEIGDQESFLASEKRVKCTCGKVMVPGLETCPSCHASLIFVNKVDEAAKKYELWAKKFGITGEQTADADSDGFTNIEEYERGTDPTDAKSHPDYLESLKLRLPLKQTKLPFYLKAVNKIPAGYRCEFVQGRVPFSATIGESLVVTRTSGVGKATKTETGFKLVSAEKKERKVSMAGVAGSKLVDASVATIERVSDGKKVELVVSGGKPKYEPIDVQATLLYERGEAKIFDVVQNGAIELNGTKYKVLSVKGGAKSAEVVLENVATGKKGTIRALD